MENMLRAADSSALMQHCCSHVRHVCWSCERETGNQLLVEREMGRGVDEDVGKRIPGTRRRARSWRRVVHELLSKQGRTDLNPECIVLLILLRGESLKGVSISGT